MNNELIEQVAWVGSDHVRKPVRGIVFRFAGLGGTTGLKNGPDAQELEWAQAGALIVHPYYNPWAWMNGQTVRFLDELLAALVDKYALPPSLPVIATGGSMGGHAALAYALKSSHKIAACYANCPVCDLLFHYSERVDLPRTFHSAFDDYGNIEEQLRDYSPLHRVELMPRIKYLIIHGGKDQAVSKADHSDKLVGRLKKTGHDVTYREEPDMAHCGPFTDEAYRATTDFVTEVLRKQE